jgi:hypothetical protein
MARTPSPTRTKNNVDARSKLAASGVCIDRNCALPSALADHIHSVIRKPRVQGVEVSPNAKRVVDIRAGAALQNEDTAVRRIEPHLLFRGEADQSYITTPIPLITSKDKVYLQPCFLPEPKWATGNDQLARPIPDTCIGYVTHADAMATIPPSAPAFTEEDDRALQNFAVAQTVHFPFLTSQWKAPNSRENLMTAANQAARDGAVIVNHLHAFYSAAYPDRSPDVVDTCHFSLTCDINTVEIWVHWRDTDSGTHHMEQIDNFSMRKESAMREARALLRNIIEYATGGRLDAIKAAMPWFRNSQRTGRIKSIAPPQSEVGSASGEGCSSVKELPLGMILPPLTPSSMGSESEANSVLARDPKKRKLGSRG